jgi:S1-C subfamily serine protease
VTLWWGSRWGRRWVVTGGPTRRVADSATSTPPAASLEPVDASRISSFHVPGEVYDTAVGTTGRENAVSIDVGTLTTLDTTVTVGRTNRTGLMASVLQSAMPTAIGGPLVNLNGQVIGITAGVQGAAFTSSVTPSRSTRRSRSPRR